MYIQHRFVADLTQTEMSVVESIVQERWKITVHCQTSPSAKTPNLVEH